MSYAILYINFPQLSVRNEFVWEVTMEQFTPSDKRILHPGFESFLGSEEIDMLCFQAFGLFPGLFVVMACYPARFQQLLNSLHRYTQDRGNPRVRVPDFCGKLFSEKLKRK